MHIYGCIFCISIFAYLTPTLTPGAQKSTMTSFSEVTTSIFGFLGIFCIRNVLNRILYRSIEQDYNRPPNICTGPKGSKCSRNLFHHSYAKTFSMIFNRYFLRKTEDFKMYVPKCPFSDLKIILPTSKITQPIFWLFLVKLWSK